MMPAVVTLSDAHDCMHASKGNHWGSPLLRGCCSAAACPPAATPAPAAATPAAASPAPRKRASRSRFRAVMRRRATCGGNHHSRAGTFVSKPQTQSSRAGPRLLRTFGTTRVQRSAAQRSAAQPAHLPLPLRQLAPVGDAGEAAVLSHHLRAGGRAGWSQAGWAERAPTMRAASMRLNASCGQWLACKSSEADQPLPWALDGPSALLGPAARPARSRPPAAPAAAAARHRGPAPRRGRPHPGPADGRCQRPLSPDTACSPPWQGFREGGLQKEVRAGGRTSGGGGGGGGGGGSARLAHAGCLSSALEIYLLFHRHNARASSSLRTPKPAVGRASTHRALWPLCDLPATRVLEAR